MSQTRVSQICWVMGVIGGTTLAHNNFLGFVLFVATAIVAMIVDVSQS